MKKLLFKITVPDKYTGAEYKAGEVYEFENKRADEILTARTTVTGEPYAVEYKDPIEEEIKVVIDEGLVGHGDPEGPEGDSGLMPEEFFEEKPVKKTRKKKNEE